jgi:O-antigen ligase
MGSTLWKGSVLDAQISYLPLQTIMKISRFITFEGFLVFSAFVLANLRATMFVYLYPDTSKLLGPAWIEIFLWFIVFLAVAYKLKQERLLADYVSRWRRNGALGLFVFLALISVFWSVDATITLFRALELLFATLVAAYIGIRYRSEQLMEMLFWFGATLLILNVTIVYAAPNTGIMDWRPYNGAWRGLYWNRNHLASFSALLSAVFMCRMIVSLARRNAQGILDGVFYFLSLAVLYFAKSATGYILFITLHFFIFCAWLWLKISQRLQTRHYYLLAALSIAGMIISFTNLETILGLFNRSTSLTGRVPLWEAILTSAVSVRPWLGHGFGALWSFESFRLQIMELASWVSQPHIADNGYLEILLHLGVFGLVVLVIFLCTVLVRSCLYGLTEKTFSSFFPLLVILYALVANVTFSLFAETEVFIWMLIVAVLFIATPRGKTSESFDMLAN